MKKHSNKDKIIEQVKLLMDEDAFSTMTVREICGRADVSIGSFYHHFKSKEDLIMELFRISSKRAEENQRLNMNNENEWKNLDAYMPTLKRNVIIAVLLYILSPIGYVLENPLEDGYNIVFLVLIALATSLISYTLIKYSSLRDILAYRDPKKQEKESWMNKFSAILWISTIAIFLIYSYTSGNWGRSWIIFVIAGVIQIAVSIIFD